MKHKKPTKSSDLKLKTNDNASNGGLKRSRSKDASIIAEAPDNVFPNWSPWLLYFVTVAIRISYVKRKSNWWIYHPDEVFQSVEVGFSEVFGYGLRTYEFFPPPGNDSTSTSVEEQERLNGMYSLRSFIYPQFYALVFWVLNCLHVAYSPYVASRIAHVLMTSFLPVVMYHFTQTLYHNIDISWTVAILTAFSRHLSVMGTHTIVNSFIGPFSFFCIGNILSASFPALNGKAKTSEKMEPDSQRSHQHHKHQNGDIGNNLPMKAKKPKINAVVLWMALIKKTRAFCQIESCSTWTNGLVLGIICYLRFDTLLFIFVMVSTFALVSCSRGTFMCTIKRIMASGIGFCVGFTLGGIVDKSYYGVWFISPLQWYNLNVKTNIPSILFGTQGVEMYFNELFFSNTFLTCFHVAAVVGLWISLRVGDGLITKTDKKNTIATVLACVITFSIYSCVGHKEIRFLHNIISLIIVPVAFSLYMLFCRFCLCNTFSALQSKYAFYVVIVMYIGNSFLYFPSPFTDTDTLETKRTKASSEINVGLDFISYQTDTSGVFVDSSIYQTAGFSVLRHDVPVLLLIHNEYHEYLPSNKSTQSIRLLNRFNDFIWVSNFEYLTKFLLENLSYNYLLTRGVRQQSFKDLGFSVVHEFGSHVVMKRDMDKKLRETSKRYAKKLTYGTNSTVLEYEASWLFTAGLYRKAIARAARAAEIDDHRVRIYQLTGMSYYKMEMFEEAHKTERKCYERHGEKACRTPQTRVVLQPEYIPLDLAHAYNSK